MRRSDLFAYLEVLVWGVAIIALPLIIIAILFLPIGALLGLLLAGILVGILLGAIAMPKWLLAVAGIFLVLMPPFLIYISRSNVWPIGSLLSIGMAVTFVAGVFAGYVAMRGSNDQEGPE
ncbi:MAG: hypothetical protein WBN89_01175 [Prochlorococcaceae cyanobacterium]